MLIAEKGCGAGPARSKRRSSSTRAFSPSNMRHCGDAIPAVAASLSATASQRTAPPHRHLFGNFAIATCPSGSLTEAFGRAPPREEPGASSELEVVVASFVGGQAYDGRAEGPASFTSGGICYVCRRERGRRPPRQSLSAPCRAASLTAAGSRFRPNVRGAALLFAGLAALLTLISARPQRSGAESPIAPNICVRPPCGAGRCRA